MTLAVDPEVQALARQIADLEDQVRALSTARQISRSTVPVHDGTGVVDMLVPDALGRGVTAATELPKVRAELEAASAQLKAAQADLDLRLDDADKQLQGARDRLAAAEQELLATIVSSLSTQRNPDQPNAWLRAWLWDNPTAEGFIPSYADILGKTANSDYITDYRLTEAGEFNLGDNYLGMLRTLVRVTATTQIAFDFYHDDACRIYVDGVSRYATAAAAWGTKASASFSLSAGWHVIDILWSERAGGDGIYGMAPSIRSQVTEMCAPVSPQSTAADAAQALATAATADGRVTVSANAPTTANGTGKPVGAVWFRKSGSDFIGAWEWSGSEWQSRTFTDAVLASLDVAKLSAGTANIGTAVAQKIAAASGQFIELDVSKLVAIEGVLDEAVINKLWADVVVQRMSIADEFIGENAIISGAITTEKLAANAVTADKIVANAITTEKLAADAVTADKIVANAITGDKIAANAIDGKTITGALIRTAASGQRVETEANRLRFYGGNGATGGYIQGRENGASGGLLALTADADPTTATGILIGQHNLPQGGSAYARAETLWVDELYVGPGATEARQLLERIPGQVDPTSVVGATLTADGTVIPTPGASTIRLDGIFTSKYRIYRVDWVMNLTGEAATTLRLTLDGIAYTGATYNNQRLTATGGSTAGLSEVTQTSWPGAGILGPFLAGSWEFTNPNNFGPKFLKSDTMRAPGSAMALDRGWLGDRDSTAFDGIEFSINGQSITGSASFMRIRGIA